MNRKNVSNSVIVGGYKPIGKGELKVKLTVKVNKVSASAKQAVEAAGGTVEVI